MKQKTRIIIYIAIAVTVLVSGILAVLSSSQGTAEKAQKFIDLGNKYLIELSYDKAVIQFTKAIEIEPKNADAYIGLAEAYIGLGDTDSAVDALERGFDQTGDERLKEMINGLIPEEIEKSVALTTAETTITTTEESTTTTITMTMVPDLSGLTKEEAIAVCESAGLNYSVLYDYSEVVEEGYVIEQTIPVNATVSEGIIVSFTVSIGVKDDMVEETSSIVSTSADELLPNKDNEYTSAETTVITTETITETTTETPKEEFITIKGQTYSTLLTELDLVGMELTNEDIKPLTKMVNLTHLYLSDNQISDLDPLSGLTNLTELWLRDNNISDVSALSRLTNLTYLDSSGNQISSISALRKLTNLTQLLLYDNQISDISALGGLINLKLLALGGNQISDISALNGLTNLTVLELPGNQINNSDIEKLKEKLPNCSIF